MQNELLLVYENQLLEKENSGCRALLKDDKVLLQVASTTFSVDNLSSVSRK